MSLVKELKIQTFVLLVRRPAEFKPSEFNQYWLDVNKIIDGASLNKLSTFSPLIVQAMGEKMNLIVTQDQIQIAPTTPETFKDIILENSVRLVSAMEEIELNGLGLNFNWYLHDDSISSAELSAKYFVSEKNPINAFFKNGAPNFGSYLSKDITEDVRLKLDIKPVYLYDMRENKTSERLQFAFNFHSDLKTDKQKEKVLEILSQYDTWFNTAQEIMNSFK